MTPRVTPRVEKVCIQGLVLAAAAPCVDEKPRQLACLLEHTWRLLTHLRSIVSRYSYLRWKQAPVPRRCAAGWRGFRLPGGWTPAPAAAPCRWERALSPPAPATAVRAAHGLQPVCTQSTSLPEAFRWKGPVLGECQQPQQLSVSSVHAQTAAERAYMVSCPVKYYRLGIGIFGGSMSWPGERARIRTTVTFTLVSCTRYFCSLNRWVSGCWPATMGSACGQGRNLLAGLESHQRASHLDTRRPVNGATGQPLQHRSKLPPISCVAFVKPMSSLCRVSRTAAATPSGWRDPVSETPRGTAPVPGTCLCSC